MNLEVFAYIWLAVVVAFFVTLALQFACRKRVKCPKCGRDMAESYLVPGTWFCSRCREMVVERKG